MPFSPTTLERFSPLSPERAATSLIPTARAVSPSTRAMQIASLDPLMSAASRSAAIFYGVPRCLVRWQPSCRGELWNLPESPDPRLPESFRSLVEMIFSSRGWNDPRRRGSHNADLMSASSSPADSRADRLFGCSRYRCFPRHVLEASVRPGTRSVRRSVLQRLTLVAGHTPCCRAVREALCQPRRRSYTTESVSVYRVNDATPSPLDPG